MILLKETKDIAVVASDFRARLNQKQKLRTGRALVTSTGSSFRQ